MKILFTFFILVFSLEGFAQIKLPVKAMIPVKKEVQTIALDFYNDFKNSKGKVEYESHSQIIYGSRVVPKGAIKCVIVEFPHFNTYTWEAKMLRTVEYEEATKLYLNFYRQLHKTKISFAGGTSLELIGDYIIPKETKSFSSSVLGVETEESKYKNFKVEISLTYRFPEWEVGLLMYEKIPDNEVKPGKRK